MTYMTPSLYPTLRHRFGATGGGWVFWSLGDGEEPWGAFGEGEERPDQPDGEDRADENQPPEDTEGSRACGELKADMLLCQYCSFLLFALSCSACFPGPRGELVYAWGASWVVHQGAFRWEVLRVIGGMNFNILTESFGLFTKMHLSLPVLL